MILDSINNLINEEHLYSEFQKIKNKITNEFGYNINYLKLIINNNCIDINGKAINMKEPCSGSWTKNKIIYMGNLEHQQKVINFYKLNYKPDYFFKLMVAHEIGHEIWNNHLSENEKKKYNLKLNNFKTDYLKIVPKHKYEEERFSEYVSYKTIEII